MKGISKILALTGLSFCAAQAQNWRALIVYTDYLYVPSSPLPGRQYLTGTNLHASVFAPLFDEMNDIYANSGADARAEIAGVIWDKSFTSGGAGPDLSAIAYNYGGMVKYKNLLDEYAADVLILRDGPVTNASGLALFHSLSGSGYPTASTVGHGAFWVGYDYPWIWVHEAGHSHNATHCDGYRKVINGALANVPHTGSTGVAGFNDVMAYRGGNDDCLYKYDDGQHEDFNDPASTCTHDATPGVIFGTTNTYTLSNPSTNYWLWHPTSSTWLSYSVGLTTPTTHNAVAVHNTWDNTIRGYRSTPSNLTITSTMDMEEFDYADFRSTGTVTIQPGFSARNVSQMRITVGSGALTKQAPKEEPLPQARATQGMSPGIKVSYSRASKSVEVALQMKESAPVTINVYDLSGQRVGGLQGARVPTGPFLHKVMLEGRPSGTYLVQVTAGAERASRKIVKD